MQSELSFQNFVEIDENKSALDVAKKVGSFSIELPSTVLFLGDSGTGKTHLLRAIESQVRRKSPEKKVLFFGSGDFMLEHIDSVRFDTQAELRNKLSEVDLLLIDDAQFFEGKEHSQNALIATIEALQRRRSRVVFAASGSLSAALSRKLVNVLELGLTECIGTPAQVSRTSLLRFLTGKAGVYLNADVFDFVLKKCHMANVRSLVGIVDTLRMTDDRAFKTIEMPIAKSVLRRLI